MINELKRIAMHFGKENQIKKLREECQELIEAIDSGIIENIIEELADVEVIVDQMNNYLLIRQEFEKKADIYVEKINRTLKKIQQKYYDNDKKLSNCRSQCGLRKKLGISCFDFSCKLIMEINK